MAQQRSTRSSATSDLGLPPYLDVAPRFGTLRDFRRPTYGDRQAKIARLIRKPFMPWQQYVADVMGEVDPKTGLRCYREGLLTLMRQQGKTTYVISAKVHRALDTKEPQLIQFAAQDGIEAKKKWLQHAELLKKTPLKARLASITEPVTSNGKEALTWSTGSVEFPISSRPSSGHGDTLDLGLVTEAFSQGDYRYEETMLPAMSARPDAQFLAESTMGTALSLYWNERTEKQRERLEAEPTARGRVAYFDWSFDEEQDDVGSPETWLRRIPALGHTMRIEEVQHAWDTADTPTKLRLFRRGFGNIPDLGAAGESVFDLEAWEATADDSSVLAGTRAFALDITPDRTWASIGWAGENRAGIPHHEVIKHERNTHWVRRYLREKLERQGATTVYIVAGTQAALMVDDLENDGIPVRLLNRAEYAAACARYSDAVNDKTHRHLATGQEPLDLAIAGAEWSSGGQRIFLPKDDTTDISPLVVVVAASEGYRLQLEDDYDVMQSVG